MKLGRFTEASMGQSDSDSFLVDCLIAFVASDTPIFAATSRAHLPADFKDFGLADHINGYSGFDCNNSSLNVH
jgi:hypothetical protein